MSKGHHRAQENKRQSDYIRCWYNGLFSKVDHRKYTLKKWIDDLQPAEEIERRKLEDFKQKKELWERFNKDKK